MTCQAVFVGIDVSRARLDVCLWPDGEALEFASDGKGIRAPWCDSAPLQSVWKPVAATSARRWPRCVRWSWPHIGPTPCARCMVCSSAWLRGGSHASRRISC